MSGPRPRSKGAPRDPGAGPAADEAPGRIGWAELPATLEARRVRVEPDAIARLRRYGDALRAANEHLNLTRITDEPELVEKHLLDALLALPVVEAAPHPPGHARTLVDVGSGGGVPGLVLAIARPGWRVTLVEATGKKAAFLQATCDALDLDQVEVVNARAETAGQDAGRRERHSVGVARAVGPIATVLELTLPLVSVGGRVVLYRGPQDADAEDAAAAFAAHELGGGPPTVERLALPSGAARRLVVVEKLAPTPTKYPRRDGVPTKRPLAP